MKNTTWNKGGLLHITDNDRILVVAPHADDESIGCGGLLIKYAQQTDVLLLSDGRFGFNRDDPSASPEETRKLRRQEFENAMSFLGVKKYSMMDITNCEIYKNYSVVKNYDLRDYDFIFVPSRFEDNQDHRHAYLFIKQMIRSQKAKAILLEYEVWTPIPQPQVIFDISDVIEKKRQLLRLYPSQLKCYDYERFAYGLSLYRGGRFKRNNVEAFFFPPKYYLLKCFVRAITTYAFREKIKALFHINA